MEENRGKYHGRCRHDPGQDRKCCKDATGVSMFLPNCLVPRDIKVGDSITCIDYQTTEDYVADYHKKK